MRTAVLECDDGSALTARKYDGPAEEKHTHGFVPKRSRARHREPLATHVICKFHHRSKRSMMDELTRRGLDVDQGMALKVGDEIYYGSDAMCIFS